MAFARSVSGGESATTVWVARQGHLTRITPPEHGYRWEPLAWSPDSSRLALGRFTIPPGTNPQAPPYGPASLWLASTTAATPGLRRLPLPHVSPGQPGWPDVVVWSPDERYLAVGVGPDQACVSCRAEGSCPRITAMGSRA